ncbi:hypothetical protein GCM10009526_04380 [Glutamicibacter creatinolyticus]
MSITPMETVDAFSVNFFPRDALLPRDSMPPILPSVRGGHQLSARRFAHSVRPAAGTGAQAGSERQDPLQQPAQPAPQPLPVGPG